jgi:hypothetical protein
MAGATPGRCRTEDTQTLVEHLTTSATLGRSLEVVGACLAPDAIAHTRESQTCEQVQLVGVDCSTSQNRTETARVGAVAANITRQQDHHTSVYEIETKTKQLQSASHCSHTPTLPLPFASRTGARRTLVREPKGSGVHLAVKDDTCRIVSARNTMWAVGCRSGGVRNVKHGHRFVQNSLHESKAELQTRTCFIVCVCVYVCVCLCLCLSVCGDAS